MVGQCNLISGVGRVTKFSSSEVHSDKEDWEDAAYLYRGGDDGDVVTHRCLSERCL